MLIAAVLVGAFLFGAGDQYLGSFPTLFWGQVTSLSSAPWLLLPFLAGLTQRTGRRAALLGLAATLVAFLGYGVMTLSPVEEAHYSWQSVSGFLYSEAPAELGALVVGPLFGWFGARWRTEHRLPGALIVAAAFCLEPLAHDLRGDLLVTAPVTVGEVALGFLLAGYALRQRRRAVAR